MKRSWRSFFKKGSRSKGAVSTSTSALPHQEPRPGPAQLLEQRRDQERESGLDRHQDNHTPVQPSRVSSDDGTTDHTTRRLSTHHIPTNEDYSVLPENSISPERDATTDQESFEENYRAYLPAVSPSSFTHGTYSSIHDSCYSNPMSLGGDSRLRTGNSEMRHNEDIANRNIDHYGGNSSRDVLHQTQHRPSQSAEDYIAHRKSVTASIESPGSRNSYGNSLNSVNLKYILGTGVATEGSLIDGILPHVKNPHALPSNRKDWPKRIARDESHLDPRKQTPHGTDDNEGSDITRDSSGLEDEKTPRKRRGDLMDLREAIMRGPEEYRNAMRSNLDGIVDLRNTEDVDKATEWAPEVVHETVKPHEHEIIEERIYREIHNHEYFHYIQPVYDTEILPARHWIHNAKGELVEVPAEKLPECTGANQRWSVVRGDREKSNTYVVRSPHRALQPRIISDKKYVTPEGFERRETTWLHPPELEDMSNYDGPVVPIEFLHHPEHAPERDSKTHKRSDQSPKSRLFVVEEISEPLPVSPTLTNDTSSSSTSRPQTGSSISTPRSVQPPIFRKPIPAV